MFGIWTLPPVLMYLNIKLYYYSSLPLGNQRMSGLSVFNSVGVQAIDFSVTDLSQILCLLLNICVILYKLLMPQNLGFLPYKTEILTPNLGVVSGLNEVMYGNHHFIENWVNCGGTHLFFLAALPASVCSPTSDISLPWAVSCSVQMLHGRPHSPGLQQRWFGTAAEGGAEWWAVWGGKSRDLVSDNASTSPLTRYYRALCPKGLSPLIYKHSATAHFCGWLPETTKAQK